MKINWSRLGQAKPFTWAENAPPTVPASDFNTVSQLGHFAGGVAVVSLSTLVLGPKSMWVMYALVLILIGIKEAFIDPITESPIVAGSGLEDFGFWVFGATVAVFLIEISKMFWFAWTKFCTV